MGLAFKANTDDVRESTAIDMLNVILEHKGIVSAYDPIANDEMYKIFNDIEYHNNIYDAVNGVDGIVIMTEWNEFRSLDLKRIKNIMRGDIILDTRNILNMDELSDLGFTYDNVYNMPVHLRNLYYRESRDFVKKKNDEMKGIVISPKYLFIFSLFLYKINKNKIGTIVNLVFSKIFQPINSEVVNELINLLKKF